MIINKDIISNDEDPGIRIESHAIIKICGVSTNTYKNLLMIIYLKGFVIG